MNKKIFMLGFMTISSIACFSGTNSTNSNISEIQNVCDDVEEDLFVASKIGETKRLDKLSVGIPIYTRRYKVGNLSSSHGNTINLKNSAPTFTWTPGIVELVKNTNMNNTIIRYECPEYKDSSFSFEVFDESQTSIFKKDNIQQTSYIPSDAEWNLFKVNLRNKCTIRITGFNVEETASASKSNFVEKEFNIAVDKWTLMIYMCGNNLGKSACEDVREMVDALNENYPNSEDVNVIIESGGCDTWDFDHSLPWSPYKMQRSHLYGHVVVDEIMDLKSMGKKETFQEFLEWGLTKYPAEKTGVILWNHGNAMRGVCRDFHFDEPGYADQYNICNEDRLLNSDVKAALAGAFANTGRKQKLEFVGYSACLMQVQDVAEFNSKYFNYMIASEEYMYGADFDFEALIRNMSKGKSTAEILRACVDETVENGSYTMSYLNLSYMAAYKQAWENMSVQLYNKISTSLKSRFNECLKSCVQRFSDEEHKENYVKYGTFDATSFVIMIKSYSEFNPGSKYTDAFFTAARNLIEYQTCNDYRCPGAYGLAMFFAIDKKCEQNIFYTAKETNFINWRNFNIKFGA